MNDFFLTINKTIDISKFDGEYGFEFVDGDFLSYLFGYMIFIFEFKLIMAFCW